MCVGPELMYGGLAASVGGSLYSGRTGRANAQAQAHVARNNEKIFQANAGLEEVRRDLISARTALDESRIRGRVAETLGAQAAHFGAVNLEGGTGSPLLLTALPASQGELDVDLLRAQGMIDAGESYGREASIVQQAAGANFQAAAFDAKADDAMISSLFGAGTAFLNANARWASLAPSANPNVNRYAISSGKGGSPWSLYG
jgi:hypothetical protein